MMLDKERENALQAIVDSWDVSSLQRPGGVAWAVRQFTRVYGNWAYLCGDQFHLGGAVATDRLAARAGIRQGMEVLDVACFLGGPARYLARRFQCRVVGLDISPACIQGAVLLTEAEGLADRVSFIQGDAWDMPLEEDRFDVVWGQDSWAHEEGLFTECARVLKPGGTLAFTNSVRGDLGAVVREADDTTYEAFTAEEYGDMLTESGFEIVSLEDSTLEVIELWKDLEERLLRQRDNWQQQLGAARLHAEEESLAVTLADYLCNRIGHVRVVARKRR